MKLIDALSSNNEQLLRKCFIDKSENIYSARRNGVHEDLAQKICDYKGWIDWINYYDLAEQYLLHKIGYIKVSNYRQSGCNYKCVLISENYKNDEKIMKNVKDIAEVFGLDIIIEEDLRSDKNSDLDR